MKDERYKEIMGDLGFLNSKVLLCALRQVANEVAQETQRATVEACCIAIEESQPPETTPWDCVGAIRKKVIWSSNAIVSGLPRKEIEDGTR